jgi:hypothetical protein
MATRDGIVTKPGGDFSLQLVTWSGLLNGDSGSAVKFAEWADRTIHVKGTFGVGGNVIIEGSNDGVTFATLNDATGTAMGTITAESVKQMSEAPLYIRPRVSAGDGSTSLSVILLARRISTAAVR